MKPVSKLSILHAAVRRVGRLRVSEAVGIKYGTLGPKLKGYHPMTAEEERRIWDAVKSLAVEDEGARDAVAV